MSPRGANTGARSTIKSSREIQDIFRESKRGAHPLVVALISKTPEGRGQAGRVAFVAGKRLGNAVWRNRAKRVLREAARRSGGPWPGWDVVFIARENTGAAPPTELDSALKDALRRAGIVQ